MATIQLETEDGGIIEIDADQFFDLQPLPWYKRLWQWFFRKKEEVVAPEPTMIPIQEYVKRDAVANAIDAAISVMLWEHRDLEEHQFDAPKFRVLDVEARHYGAGDDEYWLFVTLESTHDHEPFTVPLHELLMKCYPTAPLSFSDFNA